MSKVEMYVIVVDGEIEYGSTKLNDMVEYLREEYHIYMMKNSKLEDVERELNDSWEGNYKLQKVEMQLSGHLK